MKRLSTLVLALGITQLGACDVKRELNQPKTQTRTMIIGGVPVHERDYKLPVQSMVLTPEIVQHRIPD